jgi:benzoyl-CoA reductase/2-hydroxyglutaryl-CoA dehydratase subunit BcrC/BadD/HgdB
MKSLEAVKVLLKDHYRNLARGGRPVAWCSAMGPVELLRAFDFEVYFPENHAALIGARRMQDRFISRAVSEGFSTDTCSYLLSDIGAHLTGESPLRRYGLEGAPAPALLACNTNQCREVFEWFSWYRRAMDVPMLALRTPRPLGMLGGGVEHYLADQWDAAVAFLENLTSRKLDPGKLREVVALSVEACRKWGEFLALNAAGGFRHSFFDQLFLMAPLVVLRGTPEGAEFSDLLIREARSLPDKPARRRLFWEGMPVWGKLRFFKEFFEREETAVVASTYGLSWVLDLDPDAPMESMARAYAGLFICRDEDAKLDWLEARLREYGVDGVVFHDAHTCLSNSNTRFQMPRRLSERTGLPSLTLYGDMVDLKHFSDAETRMRLEAFLEAHG